MGASDDEEEYVVWGTPLQDEQETVRGQYKKAVQEPGLTKALPVHKQEVTDEQGRRRFHGAFTGGYSAGYYNTVGSLEGWAPSTFKSTRDQPAGARQQAVEDFMDEDELAELGKSSLQTTAEYDTFGQGAAERARRIAATEQQQRPGLPSFVPDDLITPVADSIGVQLLQKMGWRQGKGIGMAAPGNSYRGGSRWGGMAGLGTENVPIYALPIKNDTHGLGFDPFKGAEEFRAAKRGRDAPPDSKPRPGSKRARGIAFGTGVLDEDDVYGMTQDYVMEAEPKAAFNFEIASDEEDAPSGGRLDTGFRLPGRSEPLMLQSADDARNKYDLVPGFVKATHVEEREFFPPPKIPPGSFNPVHRFDDNAQPGAVVVGKEPPAPTDPALLKAIHTLAPFVAKMGPAFEALAVRKNSADPAFRFLAGGEGSEYYRWRVRAEKAAKRDLTGLAIARRSTPLTADDRASLLGEQALASTTAAQNIASSGPAVAQAQQPARIGVTDGDRQVLQSTLHANFTPAATQDMTNGNPSQAQTYGLRPGKATTAATLTQPAGPATQLAAAAVPLLAASAGRFASSGTVEGGEQAIAGLQVRKTTTPAPQAKVESTRPPRRSVEEWRPVALLCKRFNVPDPYRGKAAPAAEASRFKMDTLMPLGGISAAGPMPANFGRQDKAPLQPQLPVATQLPPPPEVLPPPPARALPPPPPRPTAPQDASDMADAFLSKLLSGGQPQPVAGVEQLAHQQGSAPKPVSPIVERPMDLFKAIFEDDDDQDDVNDAVEANHGGEAQEASQQAEPGAVPSVAEDKHEGAPRRASHGQHVQNGAAATNSGEASGAQMPLPALERSHRKDKGPRLGKEDVARPDTGPSTSGHILTVQEAGHADEQLPSVDMSVIQEALKRQQKAQKERDKKSKKDKEKKAKSKTKKGHKKHKRSSKKGERREPRKNQDSDDTDSASD